MLKLREFITLHPIFTAEEAQRACFKGKARQSSFAALHRAEKGGYVRRLKQGLYQARPAGMNSYPPPSPLLVASRLSRDAVLSHHSAFEALGVSHSVFPGLATYWTESSRHEVKIQGVTYHPLVHPEALRRRGNEDWGVETTTFAGLEVRTTGRERTFIDCLQGLRWTGGWDEFCHCVDKFSHLDIKKLLHYTNLIGSPALISRLGLFLTVNRDRFFANHETLAGLDKIKSRVPIPLIAGDKSAGKLNTEWNVVVPKGVTLSLRGLS